MGAMKDQFLHVTNRSKCRHLPLVFAHPSNSRGSLATPLSLTRGGGVCKIDIVEIYSQLRRSLTNTR